MAISFSGLASGLDTSGWVDALVSVKQEKITGFQTDLKALQYTKNTLTDTRATFNSLRTALEKLTDAKFGGAFDLFGQNTATSSDESIFTVKAGSNAARQSYDITVQQLATNTKATSLNSASAVADDETLLSALGISAGSLSIYVDGVRTAIDIEEGDKLADLKADLDSAQVKAELNENGMLVLSAKNEEARVDIGSTTDTSNLISIMGLTQQEDGSYISSNSLFKANTSSKLTSIDSGFKEQITAGTFTIGDATFTISEETTLSSIISQINKNEKAQATAHWDDTEGKLVITSKKEGASYINIQAGTSNFTDVMGLTETERDGEGNIIKSKMYTQAQDLGKNALLTINGTSVVSTSNTVSADVSRLTDVTIDLKGITTPDEEGNIKSTKLDITQDTSKLVDAVKGFVEAYNNMVAKVDEVTANGADLHGETSLTSLTRTLKSYATSSNTSNGGAFRLLSQIGISTEKADGTNLSSDTSKLEFDENAFKKALEEDPASVEAILAGENGVLSMMENSVEMSLKASVGFFDVKQGTLDSDIREMEDKITKQTAKVANYKAQLQDKFSNMELMISKMQQNYSNFLAG